MSSYKFTLLTLDDRISIQKALKEGKTFLEIATEGLMFFIVTLKD